MDYTIKISNIWNKFEFFLAFPNSNRESKRQSNNEVIWTILTKSFHNQEDANNHFLMMAFVACLGINFTCAKVWDNIINNGFLEATQGKNQ